MYIFYKIKSSSVYTKIIALLLIFSFFFYSANCFLKLLHYIMVCCKPLTKVELNDQTTC